MSHLDQLQPILEPALANLRPFTSLIPNEIVSLGRQFYTRPVFDTIVLKMDLWSPYSEAMLKNFISKTLGLGILSSSSLVKLPQIISILKSGSTSGLSFFSILLETVSYLISTAYNFRKGNDFVTFGETSFVSLQNIIILMLILYYSGLAKFLNGFVGLVSLCFYTLFANPSGNVGVLSDKWINILIKFAIPLGLFSKLPQISNNFKNKSTGQLSSVSIIAGILGSLVRIFTTISSGIKDNLLILGFASSLVLNLILYIQLVLYAPPKASKHKKNK